MVDFPLDLLPMPQRDGAYRLYDLVSTALSLIEAVESNEDTSCKIKKLRTEITRMFFVDTQAVELSEADVYRAWMMWFHHGLTKEDLESILVRIKERRLISAEIITFPAAEG